MKDTVPDPESQRADHIHPPGALTWTSAADRNRKLIPWRRAVSMTFAEQPRCLRVALGALDHLFNAKTGYAYPTNAAIADMIGLPINKVQEALLALENDGAIVRLTKITPGGQRQRLIFPATALLPSSAVTPTVGVGGHPQQAGVHNLNKRRPRLPRTQLDYARLAASPAARPRDDGQDSARGPTGWPSEQRSLPQERGPTRGPGGRGPQSEAREREDGSGAAQVPPLEATPSGRRSLTLADTARLVAEVHRRWGKAQEQKRDSK
jgi:hypothetical protein